MVGKTPRIFHESFVPFHKDPYFLFYETAATISLKMPILLYHRLKNFKTSEKL